MSFGTRLKEQRNRMEVSQTQLADILKVAQSTVAGWENGTNSPRATMLYELFDILQCDANYLFQDEIAELKQKEAIKNQRITSAGISKEDADLLYKYHCIDEESRDMINASLESAYNAYLKKEKKEQEQNLA